MKAIRIIAVAVIVLGLVLAATWLARDRIAQRLSGPLLEEYGWVITDVSLDALAARNASIGHIELVHEGGMVVAIDDLVLAVRKSSAGRREYRARSVIVTLPDDADDGATDVAAAIRQVLGLPRVLADVDVSVGELRAGDYPVLEDVSFSTFANRQSLSLNIEDSRVEVEVQGAGPSGHEAVLEFTAASGDSQQVVLRIEDLADSVRLSAVTEARFAVWHAWFERAGLLLPGLVIEGGDARVEAALDVPNGAGAQLPFRSTLVPDAAWRFRFGTDTRLTAVVTTPIDIVANIFGPEWSVGVDSADVDLDTSFAGDIDFRLTAVVCTSGVVCSFETAVVADALAVGGVRAEVFELAAEVEIEIGPGGADVLATMGPGAIVNSTGVSGSDVRAERVGASFVTATTINKTASGWKLGVDSVDVVIDGLDAAGSRTSASVFLEDSSLESSGMAIAGRSGLFVPSIAASYGELTFDLPGVRGNVTLADERIVAEMQTVGLPEEGSVRVSSDLGSGEGEVRLANIVNDFAQRPLSKLLAGPWQGFDLTAGSLRLESGFRWQPRERPSGEATLRLANVAGLYSAIAFTGVETDIDFSYSDGDGLEAKPASITAAFVDIGIALRDLSARYQLWPDEEAVDVANLEMSAFGGKITAEPFRFDTSDNDTTVLVHARSINLAEMLTIQDFDQIEVTGYVDADLPITLGDGGVRVADGRLSGLAPGGVIRYRKEAPEAGADASALGFATRALTNFEYESLTSDVSYGENGDLVLRMQIRGRNPDFENGRPIVLNLGVENNVREMLRSLQATRSAQEVIERRVNR